MRLSTYLALMFGISLVFYLMGFPTIYTQVEASGGSWLTIMGTGDSTDVVEDIYDNKGDSQGTILGIIFGATVLGSALLLSWVLGFSAIYIIPLLILIGMLNFFVFPIGMIFSSASMPAMLSVPLLFFYNFLTVMAVVTFVRGGS